MPHSIPHHRYSLRVASNASNSNVHGADQDHARQDHGGRSSPESYLAQFGRSHDATEFYSPIPAGYQQGRHKYVAVMGTVMSGLGKGIFSSSLAKLLKDKGLAVTPIKMEGYLNIDSGTLNPYRHGEVFVLDDGTECDMDLGTYERALDQNLTRANFVTSGQIYTDILDRERKGGFLGRDVQMIPHVTGEVKHRLRQLAMTGGPDGGPADVVFIEVGGTVGDYENGFFIEALRELAFEEGPGSTCFVALTYIIEPEILGEQKSKAAQLGIKRLMEAGVQPHIVACRARNPVTVTVRQKIAMFSNVPMNRVFSMHDRESIYSIPEDMWAEGLDRQILSILQLHDRVDPVLEDDARREWSRFTTRIRAERKRKINIGITGKYAALRDAYCSIDKAIEHCATHLGVEAKINWIETSEFDREPASRDVSLRTPSGGPGGQSSNALIDALQQQDCIIVPGGFGQRGVEGKVSCVRYARENGVPYLGICLGFQVAVIEFARNVLGLEGANSTEFDPKSPHPVIAELPEQKKIEGLGGTMRLGAQDVLLTPETLASHLYAEQMSRSEPSPFLIRERFRHRYEVEPEYIERLLKGGLIFSGRHPDQPIMQVLELPVDVHPYFMAAQFHPELTSRPLRPQPLFMGLLASAIVHVDPDAAGEIDPRWLRSGSEDARPSRIAPAPDSRR